MYFWLRRSLNTLPSGICTSHAILLRSEKYISEYIWEKQLRHRNMWYSRNIHNLGHCTLWSKLCHNWERVFLQPGAFHIIVDMKILPKWYLHITFSHLFHSVLWTLNFVISCAFPHPQTMMWIGSREMQWYVSGNYPNTLKGKSGREFYIRVLYSVIIPPGDTSSCILHPLLVWTQQPFSPGEQTTGSKRGSEGEIGEIWPHTHFLMERK